MINKRIFIFCGVAAVSLALASWIYFAYQQTVAGFLFAMVFQTVFSAGACKFIFKSKAEDFKRKKKIK